MTRKQKQIYIQRIKTHLLSLPDHHEDKFGHIKNDTLVIRYKFQKTSIRIERKYPFGWSKLTGSYYKDITFSENPLWPEKEVIKIGKWTLGEMK